MENPAPPASQHANPLPVPPRPSQSGGAGSGFFVGAGISVALFLVLGVIGGFAGYSAVKKAEHDARKGWNLVPVVVAAQDISENSVVAMEMISQRSIPEQFVTSSVVKPDSASYIVNQKVLVPVQAGDPLLWSQFETTKAAERLSSKLTGEERVATIKTAGDTGVGGWVRPNDKVDVVAVFTSPETKEPTALRLLENVRVLATGKITTTTNINLIPEADRAYATVSLVVSADDAERLALFSSLGTLSLTLRAENDGPPRPGKSRQTLKSVLGR